MVKNFIPQATSNELLRSIRTQPLSATGFCLPCQTSFTDRVGFVKHLSNCPAKDVAAEPYGCVRCHTPFSAAQAQDHLNHFDSGQTIGYSCMVCEKSSVYIKPEEMVQHFTSLPSHLTVRCMKCMHLLKGESISELYVDLFKHHKDHYTTPAMKVTSQPVKSVDSITLFQEADRKLKRSHVSIAREDAQRAGQAWQRMQQEASAEEEYSVESTTKFSCMHCKLALPSPSTLQTHYLTTHASAPIKQEPGVRPTEELNLTVAANPPPDGGGHRDGKRKMKEIWSERPAKQTRRSSPVPEPHNAQPDHDQQLPSESSSTEYYYLCTDCEREKFVDCSDSCNHLNHPRIPIGLDVSEHMERTGHTAFEPIQSFVSLVDSSPVFRLPNISYTPKWRNSVRRKWKTLIKDGKLF